MNKNIAFLFPGQGSQYIGMGKDLVENYPDARELFEKADNNLDIDLKSICFEGPEVELNKTENTQPAIYTISIILDKLLKTNGIKPVITAGHSLGEYSALASAGVFSFIEGLRLVRERGKLMEKAFPAGRGSMAALIGPGKEQIESICRDVDGVCEIANYNTPRQTVISGSREAIKKAGELSKNRGVKKFVELDVSGPFHSSLMEPAREELKEYIDGIELHSPRYPVVVNTSGQKVEDIEKIKEALVDQLTNSVKWVTGMKLLINMGIDTFVEVGPGRTLRGLMRRIDRSVKVYSVRDQKSLKKITEQD